MKDYCKASHGLCIYRVFQIRVPAWKSRLLYEIEYRFKF